MDFSTAVDYVQSNTEEGCRTQLWMWLVLSFSVPTQITVGVLKASEIHLGFFGPDLLKGLYSFLYLIKLKQL